MSDRWVTLLGALGALFVVFLLFYSPQPVDKISRPTSLESGSNGYLGLKKWLEESAVVVHSVRTRLDKTEKFNAIPPRGNVLLITLPYRTAMRAGEKHALMQWVKQGNSLLVLAALNDTPDWTLSVGASYVGEELEDLSGLAFYAVEREEGQEVEMSDLFSEKSLSLVPMSEHPIMQGIESLRAISDYYSDVWEADPQDSDAFYLRLAQESEFGVDALWQIPTGKGQIFLSANASLLSNRMLGEGDNAKFFSNLLAWQLAPGGAVLFDDFHQGVSDLYDPQAFFSDGRLYRSLFFLIAFWLLYLVGSSARLAPLREAHSSSQQGELVRATGVLMGRKLSAAEAGRAMVDNWIAALRRAGHLQGRHGSTPPWEALASMPLADSEVLAQIRDCYTRLGLGEKVDISKLHNNIQQMNKDMA